MPGSISEINEETALVQKKKEEEIIVAKDESDGCDSQPPSKYKTRDSISSVDSSISLSYDAAPFTPRGSLTSSDSGGRGPVSSTDDEESARKCSELKTAVRKVVEMVEESNSRKAMAADGNNRKESGNVGNSSEEESSGYERPNDELIKKIVDQVEYYFSDENIVKDAFLLKHVRRNKEGYVSLKLIASFKRVKHIAKDWRAVRDALKEASKKLEINEAGTKLRRLDPLPLYDQTTPSRTVVAVNIPAEKATVEQIAEMFRACGEIALVRILRPGNPIPADVRPFYNKHPEMHGVVSGLVEFVRTESAHNALSSFESAPDDPDATRVFELNAPSSGPSHKKRAAANSGSRNNNGASKFYHYHHHHRHLMDSEFSSSCASSSETEDLLRYKYRTMQRRCSSPGGSLEHQQQQQQQQQSGTVLVWNPPRRWSRDSGSDSPGSNFSRSRSNSGVYCTTAPIIPPMLEQRRMSAGWESSSDSYTSCRSRSNSGVSIPDVFAMRRYSLPKKDHHHQQPAAAAAAECCCCDYPSGPGNGATAGRRYSFGKNNHELVRRCSSDNGQNGQELYRGQQQSNAGVEYYCPPQHRNSFNGGNVVGNGTCATAAVFERRSSLGKAIDNGPNWSSRASNNGNSGNNNGASTEHVRRLSTDSEGRGAVIRQRSFGNGSAAIVENVIRLPRGPDGGRGFQRDLVDYALPE